MSAWVRWVSVLMVSLGAAGCVVTPRSEPADVEDISTTRAAQPSTQPSAQGEATAAKPVFALPQPQSGPALPVIYFEQGGARLGPPARTEIRRTATMLNGPALSEHDVVVTGFSDVTGAAEENVALSLSRAETVARELVLNGVARERLSVQGRGAPSSATPADQRAAARRVEITLRPPAANGQ